ncbi:MAG: polysaccharide deacetylase, partial [Clostridia bacterium]|nr:polysaccharide deacetylase [Clostridia bacterium]
NLGYTPVAFAYPFGSVSEASYNILKEMGFKATLSCEERVNVIKDSEDLYMMGRYLRTNKRSAKNILE